LGAFDFLASARPGPDRRELTLELKPGVTVRQHVFPGRILVLDLMPAPSSEQVEVRTGLQDGFARIVLHWPVPITFHALTTDQQVNIRFDRPADLNAGKPVARLGHGSRTRAQAAATGAARSGSSCNLA
jgi:hypothetical protein